MKKRFFLLPAVLAILAACSGSEEFRDGAEPAVERPACSVPRSDLRRPIATDNPLFIFNIYGGPEDVSKRLM